MKINNEENKITVVIEKKEDEYIYERCLSKDNINKFIEYLFNLDYELNGSDDELYCYPTTKYFEELHKKESIKSLRKIQVDICTDICTYIDYLDKSIPNEYKIGFMGPEYNVMNIPSNNSAMYLKMLADRFRVIDKIIKLKEKENERD